MCVCVLCLPECVFQLIWFIASPFSIKNDTERECVSDHGDVFLMLSTSLKFVFVAMTTYLAFRTRKLPSRFNESQVS